MTRRLVKSMITAAAASAAIMSSVFSVSAYELERHSQAEIKDMYDQMFFDIHTYSQYADEYSAESPTYAGRLGDGTLEEGLNSINFCRYLAGLPYDIELDPKYNSLAQHASLISYLNDGLSHTPSQPEVMGDDVYAVAHEGANKSNIGKGFLNIQAAMVHGYMSDTDKDNLAVLGHRRWILNPVMKYTGLGMVDSSTAMYVRDKSRSEKFTGDYICWPPYLMPYEMIGTSEDGYAFSVTLNNEIYDKPDRNKVVVTLTSSKLGKTWTFDKNSTDKVADMVGYFNVNTQNCGINNCIIFNPGLLPEDDVVDITVNGIYQNGVEAPINYKVVFFDLLDEDDYQIKFDSTSYEVEVGESILIHGYDNPLSNNDLLLWEAVDNSKYSGEVSDYVDILQAGGTAYVTGKKEGAVRLYLGNRSEYFKDKPYATVTVTHRHERGDWLTEEATETKAGYRYRICSICEEEIDGEVLPATSLSVADVELSEATVIYNRNEAEPKVRVYAGGIRLTEGVDYTVSYSNNDKVGTATVTVTGMGYFHGSKAVDFEIVKREPVDISSLDISLKDKGVSYTGKKLEPKLTIKEGGYTLVKGTDYTADYQNNVSVGTGKVTVKGLDEYKGSFTLTFEIQPADIGYPWVNDKLADVKYTGKAIMLNLSLRSQVSGEDLVEGVDYKVSYEDNMAIGTAKVIVTGIGNYSGTTTNTFNIVSPDDYKGPDDRDDVIETDYNAVIVLNEGADSQNTEVRFVSESGQVYYVSSVSGSTFYADLPEGKYVVWIARKSYKLTKADITVGKGKASLNINVYQCGDVNRDGKIDVQDVTLCAGFTKAVASPSDKEQLELADVNYDGAVNVADVTLMASHVKGLQEMVFKDDYDLPE